MSSLLDRPLDVHLASAPQLLEYDLIAARIAADRPGRVLDWGAGYGQMTARLHRLGLEATAYDYREELAAPALEPIEGLPEVQIHLSSEPVALPFEDDAFDAVLSCGVLEHVASPDGSLDELRRVLRPGGRLYVYKLPNRFSYLERIAKLAGLYYHGKLPHDTLYTKRGAVELVQRHGYAVREARYMNMLPLTVPGAAAQRGARAIYGAGRALSRVPGLRLLATNVELIADAPA